MKWKSKLDELNKMYQDAGYKKKFIGLFILIIVTAVLEILTVPHIVKQILDVEIPRGEYKRIGYFCYFTYYHFTSTMLFSIKALSNEMLFISPN